MDDTHADLEKRIAALRGERRELEKALSDLELKVLVGSVKIDAYEGMKSDEVKNKLAIARNRQDEIVKSGEALKVTTTATKKIADSQKRQILRCFNAETENIIQCVTVKNADASRAKILRSLEAINKMFVVDGVEITPAFLEVKFEELSLVYAYMLKEDEEREKRKAIREQMVEEEKVRREIEKAKQKIEKEESQFSKEFDKLMAYMQKAKDDIEKQLYIDKIQELQEKLDAVRADKENVLQREQNTRAGFVYIISNRWTVFPN